MRAAPAAAGVCLLGLVAASPATALDPTKHITQYGHTVWRVQDGHFPGATNAIAQTTDGYIWIGAHGGLVRFDGVRFVQWAPRGNTRLPSANVTALLGGRDGSLWIGTEGGLSRLLGGTLITYPLEPSRVNDIVEDRDGVVWVARSRMVDDKGSLCRIVDEAHVQCYGGADGVPFQVVALDEDANGSLWVGGGPTVLRWKPAPATTYGFGHLKSVVGITGITGVAPMPDGSLWVASDVAGQGLRRRVGNDNWIPLVTPELNTGDIAIISLYRSGNALWAGTRDQGLYRVLDGRIHRFRSADGLSGDFVMQFLEDREGTLWVVTPKGIDSFRDLPVVSFSTREGLGSNEVDTVLAGRDGTVWVGSAGSLDAIRQERVSSIQPQTGLPGSQIASLLEDHAGRLWVGIDRTLWIRENGVFTRVDMPDGSPMGLVVGLTEDVEHNIWAEVSASPRKLVRIQGGRVRDVFPAPAMPAGRRVTADPAGGIWRGIMSGDLARLRDGKLEVFPFLQAKTASLDSLVNQLIVTADGSVLGAAPFGLMGWKNGVARTLTVRNGIPCDHLFTIVMDNEGDLWLYTPCGLIRIARAQLQSWWSDPNSNVAHIVLDVFDGALPGFAAFAAAARSTDGRLWFASGVGLQMVDPTNLHRNPIAPPVRIEEVVADRQTYALGDALRLPPLTRDVEINYTALSFVVPRKVRFRYKLEGHDRDWVDPGTRRQAFYSDLGPGEYVFRVVASNNDGVWNNQGATLSLILAPAWYQMGSVRFAGAVVAGLLLWSAYRRRVRHVAAALSARFDERLHERTRVAQDLHDTLLQSVHASKMLAEDALVGPPDAVRLHDAVERLSLWLGQAVREGRVALNALRTSTAERNDLADALREAIDDCVHDGSPKVTFSAVGDAKEMHPIARDEIRCIGQEAIRNACRHADASHLEIELVYATDLTLRVKDNGAGIDPVIAAEGKAEHYGISGMRERAAGIGGALRFVNRPGGGTEVELVVPGRVVFTRRSRFSHT